MNKLQMRAAHMRIKQLRHTYAQENDTAYTYTHVLVSQMLQDPCSVSSDANTLSTAG